MKEKIISILLWMFLLTIFLTPTRQTDVSAFSDNLWTRDAQWANPCKQRMFFKGTRTTYGIWWTWLGIDMQFEFEGDKWYAKLESVYLLLYLFLATTISSLLYLCIKKKRLI